MQGEHDPDRERPIAELAFCFPLVNGKYPSTGKIRRWIVQGVRGVRLEGWQVGATWFTRASLIEKWIREINYRGNLPAATRPDSKHQAKVRDAVAREGFLGETPQGAMPDLSPAG